MSQNKNTQTFIQDAVQLYGNRYDYSKVNYINSKTKVIIICRDHGEFFISPSYYLQNNHCPKCVHRII